MTDRPGTDVDDSGDGGALDVLDGLGLSTLRAGVDRPDWGDVRQRSDRHRRRHRLPLVAAAAAFALVVALGALVALAGREQSGPVTSPGPEGSFILPPESATDVGFHLALDAVYADAAEALAWPDLADRVASYSFEYTTADGQLVRFSVDGDVSPQTTELPAGGGVLVGSCTVDDRGPTAGRSCWWNGSDPDAIPRVNAGLRLVDEATWQAYLQSHQATNSHLYFPEPRD